MELDHVVVFVNDLERALTFYRDQLRLKELFRERDIAALKAGTITLLLHMDNGEPKPPLPSFRVEDIDQAIIHLRGQGIDVPDAVNEGWGRVTRFVDPAGNRICMFQSHAASEEE